MAWIFFLLYPIGVPVFFAFALYGEYEFLFDITGNRDADGTYTDPDPDTCKRIGFLYQVLYNASTKVVF